MANITIASLLDKKDELKKKANTTKKLYIESLDGEITIKEPSRELCTETLEMMRDGDSSRADTHMTYNCVVEPNLKDEQLQKGFGCAEPTEIVDLLFKAGEITAISGNCLDMAGFGTGVKALDKEIKKK